MPLGLAVSRSDAALLCVRVCWRKDGSDLYTILLLNDASVRAQVITLRYGVKRASC